MCSNTSASFTLAFSYYAGLEEVTTSKVLGIIICFAGAVTVGLHDSSGGEQQQQSLIGDAVALLASVGYGMYTTILRYKVRTHLCLC